MAVLYSSESDQIILGLILGENDIIVIVELCLALLSLCDTMSEMIPAQAKYTVVKCL